MSVSVSSLLGEFDSLIMAHGDVVLSDASELFEAGTVDFVDQVKKTQPRRTLKWIVGVSTLAVAIGTVAFVTRKK